MTTTNSREIKIVHVLYSTRFGGIEKLVLDLTATLSKNPTTNIGILFGSENGEGEFLDKFKQTGLMLYFASLKSGYDVSPWKYFAITSILRKYDIVHFHSFNPFLAFCAQMSHKKIVYTEHGNFGFGRKKTWADHMKTFFLRRFLNSHVDYISFNSQFTKQVAEKRYGLDGVGRTVVYNGIALEKDHISYTGIEKSILQKIRRKFIVGTTSRFAGFKRIDRLIRGFADFQRNKDAVLLLVGDGVLRDELEQLTKRLKLSDKVFFTGFRHNVREFQNLMDVCVFPSENEPFGLVSVETLSLGKPTVVFKDGGGIVEVVGGFSQDDIVGDIPQLVERLELYFYKRDEITKNAQRRKEYSRKFNINNTAVEFNAIYKQILLCVE